MYAQVTAKDGAATVGIDIGGTKIAVLVVANTGKILARGSVPTPAQEGGAAIADAVADLVHRLVAHAGVAVSGAGVGSAGVFDRSGTVRAGSDSFREWVGFALGCELELRLGVPVHVENDVNAFLLGEATQHSDDDLFGIMLGTGVGGAMILGGQLRQGMNGGAGEIGHTPGFGDLPCTCGQSGHLETIAAGRAIAHRYAMRTERQLTTPEIAQAARAGDRDAQRVFDDAGRGLAVASVMVATLLDIPRVIVGGGVAAAWDLLQPAIDDTLVTDFPVTGEPLSIERAIVGTDAVALGAASAVRRMPVLVAA
ncbi:ROK family protein [Microbacterium sp. YY-01]|uniref:ROK family protein n=1 Tax=Microbacterium sp. YY-01 TaxID=3421634 RepID=UPI003D17308A